MSMYDDDTSLDGDGLMYALAWDDAVGIRQYWSPWKGWTDLEHAWLLTLQETEAVDNETDVNKLPSGKDVREDAEWRPVYRRTPVYARGVNDDDDDGLLNAMISTGD